jgi:hypothetical protein
MRYKEFAGINNIALPVTDHFPEPEITTAYLVYPQRIKHLNMINKVAAQMAMAALNNLDKPTKEELRLGFRKFRDIQRRADAAYAKHLASQKKKSDN